MGLLEEKVAVITGAGRGIGLAVAEHFAAQGARLVLNDLGCGPEGNGADPSVVRAAVDRIRSRGGVATGDPSDVRDADSASTLVTRAIDEHGRIDCVVSCAGVRRDRSLRKMGADDVDAVLDVEVRGALSLLRAATEAMIDQREGGAIVLMAGPLAFFGGARQSLAAAGSAALVALARSAAVELRRHRIRVNAIAPTARTRLTDNLPLFQGVTEGSMGPQHVAPVASYLASDAASQVSGEVLGVAGGRVYAFRCRETTGAFVEGRPFTPEEVASSFDEIVRGG